MAQESEFAYFCDHFHLMYDLIYPKRGAGESRPPYLYGCLYLYDLYRYIVRMILHTSLFLPQLLTLWRSSIGVHGANS